jgi:hypothetical protein
VTATPLSLLFLVVLSIWTGAALGQQIVMNRAVARAGAEASGFVRGLRAARGSGWFFAILAFLTNLLGLAALAARPNLWLGASFVLTLATLVLGASVLRVAEARWVERADGNPPTRVNGVAIALLVAALLLALASATLG